MCKTSLSSLSLSLPLSLTRPSVASFLRQYQVFPSTRPLTHSGLNHFTRMTNKLYTCFVDLKKQESISSTKKTPLQYPNLDRFPSLQGHICRPVALCASNCGKSIARSALNRLRGRWKYTMLTHITSHCLPIVKIARLPCVQLRGLVFSTKLKCLSRWTAILYAAFLQSSV